MFKISLLFLLSIIIIACKKNAGPPSLDELTNLKNYSIVETKINDTITKISGENSEYLIGGNFNKSQNKREGWWKIKNKKRDEIIEIEYVNLKKEKLNQIKTYVNGILVKSLSRYYVIENTDEKFGVKFYFIENLENMKKNEPRKEKYEVTYRILDTVSNTIQRQSTADLQKSKNYYYFETPKNKNENGMVGFADKLIFEKVNDSAVMSVETLHFKD